MAIVLSVTFGAANRDAGNTYEKETGGIGQRCAAAGTKYCFCVDWCRRDLVLLGLGRQTYWTGAKERWSRSSHRIFVSVDAMDTALTL